jgi:EAL domain-containing protein (putative c-di-GMP-specific phosphodiesterase class I)
MVEGIEESASDLAVLRGIVAMAQALGLEVTAEGIERPAQREVIAREHCTSWQGFLGARPRSAAEFMALVSR